ncbi:S8 family peptidase [Neobacillus kokaensis]|uniref:Cell wall-associated protease n=1 Tax=Neobacillus kokaensis TaxID=2759023 RepID=A0ABQ3NBC0_9BACI|nr:Ig-like domain-containing protein [Neobacillus kokaensis]GHI01209.1 cell wall-associated protease [Neobacillus kokaensis]
MNKRVFGRFASLVLIFSLFVSLLQPIAAKADIDIPDETFQLEKGQVIEKEFNQPGQIHWYKVVPTQAEIAKDTHMRIKMTGSFEGAISVYSNLERAKKDETFDAYRAYISEGPVQIDMPHAWKGPYYIKVEFYGGYYGEMEMDPETEEPFEPINSIYQIGYEGINLPPGSIVGEACPVELSTEKKASGVEILSQLRSVRDNLLSKTEQGKQLSALYYKAAPYLVTKMVLDKDVKETVYKDLVQLKPFFKDIAANSDQSSYRFSADDQKAINELYEIVLKNVPDHVKAEIEKKAKEIGLVTLTNQKVSDVFKKSNLAFSNSDTNRIIVKLKDGKMVSNLQQKSRTLGFSAASLKSNDPVLGSTFVLKVNSNVQALANQFAKLPEVEYAEPVHKYHKQAQDIYYQNQWSLENTGQDSGKTDADIKFGKLQQIVKQRKLQDVLIAVVDTGVDNTLADFEEETISSEGYDFVNRDNDPYDDEGHGTHVAGIIAAAADNNYSIAGINPKAKILPVKVLDASGSGDSDQIALGIKYAVDHGAKVINLSLGGGKSRVIEDMLKYAASKNVTVVAASGNDGSMQVSHPASSDRAIAVGATSRLDIVSDYSNYGEGLDLVAPGTEIPSLLPNGNVTFLSGTSMAAPHVSAVAGLLLAQNPNLTPDEIKQILTETADDVAVEDVNNDEGYYDPEYPFPTQPAQPGYDNASGWGRLNAWSAFSAADLKISVNDLTDNDTKVTGTAEKDTRIEVKNGDTLLGTTTAKADGKFSVTIKPQMANQVLQLTAKNGMSETKVKVIVKDTMVPEIPYVNQVSNLDEAVTGEAAVGTTVKVKTKSTVLGEADTDANGHFTVSIKKQKAGTSLFVTATSISGKESEAAKVIVLDKIPPVAPKVLAVSDRDQSVTGTTEANATVIVKNNGKTIGTKKADAKGKFSVAIKKQKAGTVLFVTAKDASGNVSKALKVVVKDKTAPAAPKVNVMTDHSKVVTGKAEAKATVIVKLKGKTIGTKKADAKGKFSIAIKKQKAGTVLFVTAKDASGNVSKAAKVVVKDKTAPAAPRVNVVTSQHKVVTGKTEAKATVVVKLKGKVIGTKKADAKGKFKVVIKKQKAGTVLTVTAKDAAGNTSKATKVTVKKSKK